MHVDMRVSSSWMGANAGIRVSSSAKFGCRSLAPLDRHNVCLTHTDCSEESGDPFRLVWTGGEMR